MAHCNNKGVNSKLFRNCFEITLGLLRIMQHIHDYATVIFAVLFFLLFKQEEKVNQSDLCCSLYATFRHQTGKNGYSLAYTDPGEWKPAENQRPVQNQHEDQVCELI